MTKLEYCCPLCKEVAEQGDRTNDYFCRNPYCELSHFTLWTRKTFDSNYYPHAYMDKRKPTLKERIEHIVK